MLEEGEHNIYFALDPGSRTTVPLAVSGSVGLYKWHSNWYREEHCILGVKVGELSLIALPGASDLLRLATSSLNVPRARVYSALQDRPEWLGVLGNLAVAS